MDNKYSLPPGWGERSNQDNPWENAKCNFQMPVRPQPEQKVPLHPSVSSSTKKTANAKQSDLNPEQISSELRANEEQKEDSLYQSDTVAETDRQNQASVDSDTVQLSEPDIGEMQLTQNQEAISASERQEFVVPEAEQSGVSVPDQDAAEPETAVISAPEFSFTDLDDDQNAGLHNPIEEAEDAHVSPLLILIPLAVVILAFFGGMLYAGSKNKNQQPKSENEWWTTTTIHVEKFYEDASESKNPTAEKETETTTTTEETTQTEVQTEKAADEKPDYNLITQREFGRILSQYDDPIISGYYEDIDGDARKDLILKDPVNMNFQMYQIADDGTVEHTFFGSFPSVSEVKLFRVQGNNDKCYLYWKCEYAYYSTQGYYDGRNSNEIDISIQFVEKAEQIKAKGSLRFNGSEENSGTEEVDSVYGATPKCKKALFSLFRKHDFQIDDSSDYKKMNELSADELKRLLSENN